jgi:hypothetical protein
MSHNFDKAILHRKRLIFYCNAYAIRLISPVINGDKRDFSLCQRSFIKTILVYLRSCLVKSFLVRKSRIAILGISRWSRPLMKKIGRCRSRAHADETA